MNLRILTLSVAAVLSTACATSPTGRSAEIANAASGALSSAREAPANTPWFVEHDRIWVGSSSIEQASERNLPEIFSQRVIFRRAVPVTLNQVAEYVQSSYGIPMVITSDAVDAAAGVVTDPVGDAARQNSARLAAATSAQQLQAGPPQPGQSLQNAQLPQFNLPTVGDQDRGSFLLNFEGDLKGFLDRAAAATGNSWKYQNGRVTLFHIDTRSFTLSMLPGATTLSSTITNQSAGGGGGGGEGGNASTQSGGSTATMSATIDQFTATVEAITSMLSPRGRVVAAQGISQVTVTDVPAVLDRVEQFIKDSNEIATRQVVLEVRVYAIESDRNNSAGIQWDTVWSTVRQSAGLIGAGETQSGSNRFSYSVIDPTSRFSGSEIIVDALSRQANLEELTSVTQATLNGQVLPIQTGEEAAFVENVQTTLVPDVGAQTTRTLGRINTGFSMTALPVITSGDEILLQLQANLSTLRELRRVGTVEEGQQEAPLTDTRQTFNRVKLRNGQTLVITGLEQETFRSDLRGVGNPGFQLLGGGTNRTKARTTIVIMVTPRIVS